MGWKFSITTISFLSQQFVIEDFVIKAMNDRDQHDVDLIEYVRKYFICKRLNHLEPNSLN